MKENNNPIESDIINFHQFTEKNNNDFGLQINRNNMLKTVSITQCVVSNCKIKMSYLDLTA